MFKLKCKIFTQTEVHTHIHKPVSTVSFAVKLQPSPLQSWLILSERISLSLLSATDWT